MYGFLNNAAFTVKEDIKIGTVPEGFIPDTIMHIGTNAESAEGYYLNSKGYINTEGEIRVILYESGCRWIRVFVTYIEKS